MKNDDKYVEVAPGLFEARVLSEDESEADHRVDYEDADGNEGSVHVTEEKAGEMYRATKDGRTVDVPVKPKKVKIYKGDKYAGGSE